MARNVLIFFTRTNELGISACKTIKTKKTTHLELQNLPYLLTQAALYASTIRKRRNTHRLSCLLFNRHPPIRLSQPRPRPRPTQHLDNRKSSFEARHPSRHYNVHPLIHARHRVLVITSLVLVRGVASSTATTSTTESASEAAASATESPSSSTEATTAPSATHAGDVGSLGRHFDVAALEDAFVEDECLGD